MLFTCICYTATNTKRRLIAPIELHHYLQVPSSFNRQQLFDIMPDFYEKVCKMPLPYTNSQTADALPALGLLAIFRERDITIDQFLSAPNNPFVFPENKEPKIRKSLNILELTYHYIDDVIV